MFSTEYKRGTNKFQYTPGIASPIITGMVASVNPNGFTATVVTGDNKLMSAVPILNTYGTYFTQDLTWLKSLNGTNVVLIYLGNQYYILATMPFETLDAQKREDGLGDPRLEFPSSSGVSGGKDDDAYNRLTFKNYSGRRANDLFDGDKILRAEGNSEVSALRGGVARLKGGPLAQIIFTKFKEMGMLITRTFKHFSDFGEINHTHTKEGRTGVHIQGGADYKEETHPKDPRWTVQAWLGDCPKASKEARFHLKVNNKDISDYVSISFDIKGNIYLDTTRDDTQNIGRHSTHDIAKNRTITVGKDMLTDVKGKYTLKIGKDSDIQIKGTANQKVGGSYSLKVGGSCNIQAGGPVNIKSSSRVAVTAPQVKFN